MTPIICHLLIDIITEVITRGLVSAIVVNYRTERYLKDCLTSILNQSFKPIELILINNGSRDFRKLDLREYKIDKLINNERNLGFAKANNQGILSSSGEFIFLLNADAMVPRNFVERAVEIFRLEEDIFAIVPQVRKWLEPGIVESTGHLLRKDFNCFHRDNGKRISMTERNPGLIFGGTAACIIYRRSMLEELRIEDEYFDETFFSYFEDVDLDIRANLLKLKYRYEPTLYAYHVAGGSLARKELWLRTLAEKNRYLSLTKCLSFSDILPNLGQLILYEMYHLLQVLKQPYLFLGLYYFVKYIPEAIRKRGLIQRKRRLSSFELQKKLVPRFTRRTKMDEIEIHEAEKILSSEQPLASVIVINYNGYKETFECLESLRSANSKDVEIILVDNGSKLGEAEKLADSFPEVKVILAPENLGFAGGVNLATRFAKGKYFVLLNNDTVVMEDFLNKLIAGLEEEDADSACGVLVEENVPETNDTLNLLGYNIKAALGERNVSFYPCGGAMVIRADSLKMIGGKIFDDRYFLYHEDVNLGFRIRLAGGKVAKVACAKVNHLGSITVKKMPLTLTRYHQLKNRLTNILIFYEGKTLLKLIPLILLDFLYWHFRALISLRTLIAVFKTDSFILTSIPTIIRMRYRYGKLRSSVPLAKTERARVSDQEITKFFSHKLLSGESFLNDICKFYLMVVGIPTAD